ncbi:hypothetical protein GGR55DRAFT_215295 [Xylaria sp. FL0064]|nr:hypothetical protein GGR55DRAFT_215295 [Xylaria sp. FL0064]
MGFILNIFFLSATLVHVTDLRELIQRLAPTSNMNLISHLISRLDILHHVCFEKVNFPLDLCSWLSSFCHLSH